MVALASAELFVSRLAPYVHFLSFGTAFYPALAFSMISIGNILFFLIPPLRRSLRLSIAVAGAWMPVALLATNRINTPVPILISILIPFGLLISHLFSKFNLRTVIIASALGGASFSIAFALFYQFWGRWFVSVTCAVLAVAGLSVRTSDRRQWIYATSALALAILGFGDWNGCFLMKPGFERKWIAGGMAKIAETNFGPLLITDVYKGIIQRSGVSKPRFYIVTNGYKLMFADPKPRPVRDVSAPYFLRKANRVLVIGSASGINIEAALTANATRVVAVDVNPTVFELLKDGPLSEVIDNVYRDKRVTAIVSEGRHFLEQTGEKFDLITLQGVQTATSSTMDQQALIESFLFTKESLQTMFAHLNENGMIWIAEQEFRSAGGASLGEVLIDTFRQSFPEQDPKKHILFLSYWDNDDARVRGGRSVPSYMHAHEMLFISKHEFSAAERAEVQNQRDVSSVPYSTTSLSDDHPFLFNRIFSISTANGISLSVFVFTFGALCIAFLARRAFSAEPFLGQQLTLSAFFLGVGYILALAGISGPVSLLTGHPELSTILLLGGLYFSAAFGGLVGLRAKKNTILLFCILLIATLFSYPLIIREAKPSLLGSPHAILPFGFAILLIVIFGFLSDIPYMFALNSVHLEHRPRLVTAENVGNAVGGVCLVLLNSWCSYSYYLSLAAICFVLCTSALMTARPVPPPT